MLSRGTYRDELRAPRFFTLLDAAPSSMSRPAVGASDAKAPASSSPWCQQFSTCSIVQVLIVHCLADRALRIIFRKKLPIRASHERPPLRLHAVRHRRRAMILTTLTPIPVPRP